MRLAEHRKAKRARDAHNWATRVVAAFGEVSKTGWVEVDPSIGAHLERMGWAHRRGRECWRSTAGFLHWARNLDA